MSEICKLTINERGALVPVLPNGEQIPGVQGIEITQDLNAMRSGYAQIKVTLFVKTVEEFPKPKTKPNEI